MFSAITLIIGLLITIGICNDTATFTEVVCYATLGFALMTLSVLLFKHQYKLYFVAPNGRHKTVYAHNLLGKLMATHKYTKLGYTLQTEWEVI